MSEYVTSSPIPSSQQAAPVKLDQSALSKPVFDSYTRNATRRAPAPPHAQAERAADLHLTN
jgi:hypothetical protein